MSTSPQTVWQTKITEEHWYGQYISDRPSTWWHNPTNPNSLRITKSIFQTLKKNKSTLLFYKFTLPEPILPINLVQLERHFTAPYYIENLSTLHVSGESEAIMLGLHGNNLKQFLDNFTR